MSEPSPDESVENRDVERTVATTESLMQDIDRLGLITHPAYTGPVDRAELIRGVIAAVEVEGEQGQLLEYAHRASVALHGAAGIQDAESSHAVGIALAEIFNNPEIPADQRYMAGKALVAFVQEAPVTYDVLRAYLSCGGSRGQAESEECRTVAKEIQAQGLKRFNRNSDSASDGESQAA